LCQLEIPLDTVQAALESAYERNVVTILDPAPARDLPDRLLHCTSVLTPNQTEAAMLLNQPDAIKHPAQAEQAARALQRRGAKAVIVKMGEQGVVAASETETWQEPGFPVSAVDTTAAGDSFNGALAAEMSRGESLKKAIRVANAAAALSVTKPGAIASLPTLDDVRGFASSRLSRE
jgi:ribokinase